MHDVELVFNPEHNSWNVFVDGEWYCEDNYENAVKIYNLLQNEED